MPLPAADIIGMLPRTGAPGKALVRDIIKLLCR
jgi:hypothetical protein